MPMLTELENLIERVLDARSVEELLT